MPRSPKPRCATSARATSPATSSPRWWSSAPSCPRRRWARSCGANCATRSSARCATMQGGFGRLFFCPFRRTCPVTTTAIVSALHEELAAVPAPRPDEQQQVVGGRTFWCGHLHGHDVVAVLSGIGKVAAATTATVLVERFGVQRIVFTGVAGGLAPGVRVGDVVVAQRFLQHDMDASPIFPRHEVPGYGRASFDADAALSAQL